MLNKVEITNVRFKKGILLVGLFIPLILSSCYYDNYDDLAVGPVDCDTTSMTYTMDIAPIMSAYCTSCHSGAAPAGNTALENYDDVKVSALNGSLLGTMDHASGWPAMPKNQPKLDECIISKVRAWINQGVRK